MEDPAALEPAEQPLLLVLVAVAGALLALQAFLNGRLKAGLDSPILVTSVNSALALGAFLTAGVLLGVPRRAYDRLYRQGEVRRLRWWHLLMGANGLFVIGVGAIAASTVGVAIFTVALVMGQLLGALGTDRLGLSPAGRQDLTRPRLFGVLLAMLAVVVATLGHPGDPQFVVIALVVLGGALSAVQQAAIGQVATISGEPIFGSITNTLAGFAVATIVVVVTIGSIHLDLSEPAPIDWLGGLCGAAVTLIVARTVGMLGVLRLSLALVAGQTAGSVLLDLASPVAGGVTPGVLAGTLMTFVAVTISGGGIWARALRRATRQKPPTRCKA